MVCFNSSGYKLSRHNAIIAAMRTALAALGVQSSTNTVLSIARGENANATSQKQPDLAVYDFHQGGAQPTLLDFVVTDPTSRTSRTAAEATPALVQDSADEEPSAEEMRRARLLRFGLASR